MQTAKETAEFMIKNQDKLIKEMGEDAFFSQLRALFKSMGMLAEDYFKSGGDC